MSHTNGHTLAIPLRPERRTLTDRQPPQNLEAEMGVLGGCILDNDQIDTCLTILRTDDFYRATHQTLWDAITSIYNLGYPVDAVSLPEHLKANGQFDKIGGDEFLADVIEFVPHAANTAYYAGVVREKAIARKLIEVMTETITEAYANQHTARELLARAEQRVLAIDDRRIGDGPVGMDVLIGEAMTQIQRQQQGEFIGIRTGFRDLDDVLCGLMPGSVTIIAGRPGAGKTALGLALAANIAEWEGGCPLFFSLEMDKRELAYRYLSAYSEIGSYTLKGLRKLDDAGWQKLYDAAGKLVKLGLKIDDTPSYGIAEMGAVARRHKRDHGLPAILVDYLGLLDEEGGNKSREQEVAAFSRGIKRLSRELDCPVIALHQLNRNTEKRDDHRPRLADLRDSGAIEQDAHNVLLLHRPDYYDLNDHPGIAEVIIAKNRNGATLTVELAFNKAWTRFDSLAKNIDEPAF